MNTCYNFKAIFALLFLCLNLGVCQRGFSQCSTSAIEIPNNGIDEDCDNLDDIFLHLPAYIYMVEGNDFELYFRNIILSTHPQDYVFEVQTALPGLTANGKWSFTPTFSNSGEHSFTVIVKAPNGQVLSTATSVVRISPATTPTSVNNKTMIMTGHSFVNQGYMPYYYRLLTEKPGTPTITLKGKQANWVDGISVHEAIGGASWKFFLKDPSSPYWYFNRFDMDRYFNDVLCQGCRPDMVLIHLDVADYCFPGSLTGNTIQEIEDFVDDDYALHVEPFINALRAAAPNTKIAICYASPPNARENAFINHFGANSILSNRYRWKKIVNTLYFKWDEYFKNRENENIYLLPIHLDIDDVNEFDQNDPVHPWKIGQSLAEGNGYKEIAKTTFAWTKYILNLGTNGACLINSSVTNKICDNNGSSLNPTDDTYSFDVTLSALNAGTTWTATINGQAITGSYGTAKNISGLPIAAGPISFTVADQANPACTSLINVNPPQTCSNGSGSTIDLKIKMSSSIPNPSIYSNFLVTVTIENTAPLSATNVKAFIPKPNGTITYNSGMPFVASQGLFRWYSDFIWDIGDIPPLGSATLTIPYYLLSASPFDLYAEIETASPSDDDSTPGNGNGVSVNEDDEFILKINAPSAPPCSLTAAISTLICDDNGTNANSSDDTFTFNLNVAGSNAGANGWVIDPTGSTLLGQYGASKRMGPYPISGGALTLLIQDVDNPTCSISEMVTPPASCSNTPSCSLTPIVSAVACSNNGTPSNPNDDTFTFVLRVNGTGTSTTWTSQINGMPISGSINLAKQFGPYPISGGVLNLVIRDENNPSCTVSQSVIPPPTCSNVVPCSLTATVSALACDNNGTNADPSDDIFTFNLRVNGNNTGATGWTTNVNGTSLTGQYGVAKQMGPYPISGAALNLLIQDVNNPTCSVNQVVTAPATCSNTGAGQTDLELSMTGSAQTMPIYSLFSTTITITNTSSIEATAIQVRIPAVTNAVFQGGNEGSADKGTFAWWNNQWTIPALAAGETAILTANYFTLSADPIRFYAEVQTVSPTDSDSEPANGNGISAVEDDEAAFSLNGEGTAPCTISASTSSVLCSNNNTPTNSADDTFSFDLTASGTGSAWTTSIGGQTIAGSHGSAKSFGPYLISDGNIEFILRDATNMACMTTISVTAPETCSVPVTGNCASSSAYPWHEWISSVQVGTFINNSGKAPFTDYSNMPINITKGAGQGISLTAKYSFYTYDEFVKIWIDYNQNGIYEEPFELAFSGRITAPEQVSNASKKLTGLISIPNSAMLGTTSMRVSMKRGAYPAPCETLPYGEVEDYAVIIQPARIILSSQPGASASDLVLHFSAQEDFGTVVLDWVTQAGVQTIDILSSQDGHVFEQIGRVEKMNEKVESMQFIDPNPNLGLNFYQLRAKNKGGTEYLTNIRSLTIQGEKASALLFPNPAHNTTRLRMSKTIDKAAQVHIYSSIGKLVQQIEVLQNNQYVDLDTSDFSPGLYTVQVIVSGQRPLILKLLIQE